MNAVIKKREIELALANKKMKEMADLLNKSKIFCSFFILEAEDTKAKQEEEAKQKQIELKAKRVDSAETKKSKQSFGGLK